MTDQPTVGELLSRCLRSLGVSRVYGSSMVGGRALPGLGHVLVEDPALAVLLADAAGRIGSGPGAAVLPDGRLHLGSQPGGRATEVVIDDPAQLPAALAGWTLGAVHTAVDYRLDLDLAAPAPPGTAPVAVAEEDTRAYTLDPSLADLRLVVLAGPGVVRSGHVERLRAFAERAACPVVNTWGAKGMFLWDSPFHAATVGLQARDFELAGLLDADVIIATGLDPAEAPPERWSGRQVLEVDPAQLDVLAARWPTTDRLPGRPPLYGALAEVIAPRYSSDEVPLAPARAVADLVAARPAGGVVAADPGPAGLWVARAFTTTEPVSAVVPSQFVRGFALAAAIVAALDGRPAAAVATDPLDPASAELLALAEHWRTPIVLDVWGADAALPTAEGHRRRLVEAFAQPGPSAVPTPVDLSQTRDLVAVAGEVIAWADGAAGAGGVAGQVPPLVP